mmetsp:Transcript_34399/g.52685  ORF Transcript_34399/g.52685 Transcript_34399/m.52685 type:complete len:100 (-) Transcript_34399:276-575(-)
MRKFMAPWVIGFVVIGIAAEVNKFNMLEYNSAFVISLLAIGTVLYLAVTVLVLTVNRWAPQHVLISMLLMQLRLVVVQLTRLRQMRELVGVDLPATLQT